jgi:hypothetical protein
MAYLLELSCGVNKEVKENNNNNKKKKSNLGLLYTNPGSTDNNLKVKKKTQNYEPNEFDRMRVKQFQENIISCRSNKNDFSD